ncbi:NAD-dependent epimerase/dehydratase family protein [Polynucleobacter asymbioticus]|uniref:NAD-dependent epimerase/dehydratase family protein n=1 Tax=Polynucleobacter asymbioticus TaxID=576611 RepID=UPI0008F86316|nr:NAD-dependent epimerase/dehydratase family protein [Polynucleobacter asymbioticus]
MKKHIFITGVAGFLGSHMADKFISDGWKVSGCDNLIGGYKDNVHKDVDFYEHDCLDLEAMTRITKGVDVIYHTACTAYEGLSVFSPSMITANTTQISVNCMTAAIRNGVKRFVHCSSMARYGTQDTYPFTEDMVCKPQDPYGIAKYAAELLLKNLSEVHGTELVIAVPHNIIGPRQKYDDPYRNVVSIMVNLMLQNRQPIIYGDGSQVRCFSSIEDDVDCLYYFATSEKAVGNTYNIGPDENPITVLELAKKLAKLMDFKLDPIFMEGRPQEVKYATCSAEKIRREFGYKTKINLDESLKGVIDYIENRGTRKFAYHLPVEIISEKTPKTWSNRLF